MLECHSVISSSRLQELQLITRHYSSNHILLLFMSGTFLLSEVSAH